MSDDAEETSDVVDAARRDDSVQGRAAREEITRVIGDLAAMPLDQQAAERMRRELASAPRARVRAALRRISAASFAGRRAAELEPITVGWLPGAGWSAGGVW